MPGDIFLDSMQVLAAPDCQPLLCCSQGGGWRASRSWLPPLLLTERGNQREMEGERRGVKVTSWTLNGSILNEAGLHKTCFIQGRFTHLGFRSLWYRKHQLGAHWLLRQVTVQECHLSTGASVVKCNMTHMLTHKPQELLKSWICGRQEA